MKNITKHWITTVAGIIMIAIGVFMLIAKYPPNYIYIALGGGILFLFLKDTWINKVFNKAIK